ncbi:MAG: hypothetical protein DMF70_03600 [Acidobacteria bacterium]|nr:MAG: hypothetical protein DMF70_03600 [Acidobacteriota bacterium]
MTSRSFDYRRIPDHTIPRKRWMKRPMLQVTLLNGTQRKQVVCLLDSGADECLFHASIGRRLGIDIESGRHKRFDGIAGSLEAYMHMIEIQIQDFPGLVEIEVGFTESDGVDAILGQAGFFENFRICFDRYRWKVEIASRPESTMHWQE